MIESQPIQATKYWVSHVVIACNFCPFAANPFMKDRISFIESDAETMAEALVALAQAFEQLNQQEATDTSLLIFPKGFSKFLDFLDLVDLAEQLLIKEGYEGRYQLASFHPKYQFAGTKASDASNYTNRSPYPMLHLLREDHVAKAVASHPNTENIPITNIQFAADKGAAFFKKILKDGLKEGMG